MKIFHGLKKLSINEKRKRLYDYAKLTNNPSYWTAYKELRMKSILTLNKLTMPTVVIYLTLHSLAIIKDSGFILRVLDLTFLT